MQWNRSRQFGTEISKNILNNQINGNNFNKNQNKIVRKRKFNELQEGSETTKYYDEHHQQQQQQQRKKVRYNLRSCTEVNFLGKENKFEVHYKYKSNNKYNCEFKEPEEIMDVDSDDDEDIDLMVIKSKQKQKEIKEMIIKEKKRPIKLKRKQINNNREPIRRSLRLKNKREKIFKNNKQKNKNKIKKVSEKFELILPDSLIECDANKKLNDLYVPEYISDIISFYIKIEENVIKNIRNNYISSTFQNDLNVNMRCILLNWLFNVHRRFKLSRNTLFLAIYIFDTYLSAVSIARSELQLIGCCSMWIASKYNEIYAAEANDFAYMSDYSFTVRNLFKMEINILCKLQFKFADIITPLQFAERYLEVATYPLYKKYKLRATKKAIEDGEKYINLVRELTFYFIELSLFDCKLISTVKPSLIAAASLCFTIISISLYAKWPDFLINYTGYKINDLKYILNNLNKLRITTHQSNYTSIRKKHPSIIKWFERLNIAAVLKVISS